MKEKRLWLFYALITTIFWGVWGAFMEIPEKAGFPATLGYVVWSLTMIPCSLFALYRVNWKLDYDRRSVLLGSAVGLLGAGGQLFLFQALRQGPAYIVFPIISLYPVLTIFLSLVLPERKDPSETVDRDSIGTHRHVLPFKSAGKSCNFYRYWLADSCYPGICDVGFAGIHDEILKQYDEGRKHFLLYDDNSAFAGSGFNCNDRFLSLPLTGDSVVHGLPA